ncbi:MAG: DUF3820 family protein [Verrucomicrobiota bacterium]
MTPEEFTEALSSTVMPFGKYQGQYIYDLPLDYLLWFKEKGFPKGQLGQLMQGVCDAKAECGNTIFDPLRKVNGSLPKKPGKKREWHFED